MGFVFGYRDARHFYLFDWKQADQTTGLAGMTVKVIDSETALSSGNLWATAGVEGKIETLYQNSVPWQDKVEYNFSLAFDPGRFDITGQRR